MYEKGTDTGAFFISSKTLYMKPENIYVDLLFALTEKNTNTKVYLSRSVI